MLLFQQWATGSTLKEETPKPADVSETVTLINALKTYHPQSVASPFHKAQ